MVKDHIFALFNFWTLPLVEDHPSARTAVPASPPSFQLLPGTAVPSPLPHVLPKVQKLIWSHYIPPPIAEMAQRWGERSEDPETEGLVSPSVREISFLNI